ncbi:MAG: hypothetical protein M0Z59_04980 [Nitrospiraceae bacterium]|nr:hypothetical protein [Nitrospiraceae bacterium]
MDWIDRASIWAITVLIIGSVALISNHTGAARPGRSQQKARAGYAPASGEMDSQAKLVKDLIDSDNLDKAGSLAQEMMRKYPYNGEPHMLMGDVLMRKQDAVKAVMEYKKAVDLDPDYLDKNTPDFEGKKLQVAVNEALADIDKKIKQNPSDESLKSDRKAVYYLQRKIAGSCS